MSCQLSGSILIETSYGNLLFGLYGKDCPQTAKNFLDLCSLGFYDGCHIPRVVRNGFFEISGHKLSSSKTNGNEQEVDFFTREQTAQEFIQNLENNDKVYENAQKTIPLEINHQILGGLLPSNTNNNSARTNRPVCVNKAGLLIMVSSSSANNINNNNNNGTRSTFLITTTDRRLDYLDRKHVILGEIILQQQQRSDQDDNSLKILREINSLALKGGKEVMDGEPIRRIHIKRMHVLDRGGDVAEQQNAINNFPSLRSKFMELLCSKNIMIRVHHQNTDGGVKYIVNYEKKRHQTSSKNDDFALSSGDEFEENLRQERNRSIMFSNQPSRNFSLSNNNSNNNIQKSAELKLLEAQLKEVRQKIKRQRDDETQKVIMQLIGERPATSGIDGADEVKPPDNVLFVCKLNPLTQDADLAHCFERFGKILSCEIIRDKKSGRSLQYAFIEFETAESCEVAFRKMEKVKIDDSRIHVDFSQSLGKSYWQARNLHHHQPNQQPSGYDRRRPQNEPGYYPPQQQQQQQYYYPPRF